MNNRIPKVEGPSDVHGATTAASADEIEQMMLRELQRVEEIENRRNAHQSGNERSPHETGVELAKEDLVREAGEEAKTFNETFPPDASPKDHPESRELVNEAKTHQQTLVETLNAIIASESAKGEMRDSGLPSEVPPAPVATAEAPVENKESPDEKLVRLGKELETAELAWQIEQAHLEQAEQNEEEVSPDAAMKASELYDKYQKAKEQLLTFRNQMKEGNGRPETPPVDESLRTPPEENPDSVEKSDGGQISQEEEQPLEVTTVAKEESVTDDEKIKSQLFTILEEIREEKLHFRPQDEAIISADIDTWKQLVEEGKFFDFSQVAHNPEQPQKTDHVDSVYGLLFGYTEKLKSRIERYKQMQFDPASVEVNQQLLDSITAVLPELESRRPKPESKSPELAFQQNIQTPPVEVRDPGHTETPDNAFESNDHDDKEKRRQYDPMRLFLREVAKLTDEEMPEISYEVLTGYSGKGNDRQPTFQTFDTYHEALAFNAGIAPEMQRVLDAVAREHKTQRIVFKWDKDFFGRIADPKDPLNRHQGRIFTLIKRLNAGKEPDAYAEAVMRREVLPKSAVQTTEAPKDTISSIPVPVEQAQDIDIVEPDLVTAQEKTEPAAPAESTETKDPYEQISPKIPDEFEGNSPYYEKLKKSSDPLVAFARDVMKIPEKDMPIFSYVTVESISTDDQGDASANTKIYTNYHDMIAHRRKQNELGLRDMYDSYSWTDHDGAVWSKFSIRGNNEFWKAVDTVDHPYHQHREALLRLLDGIESESQPDEYALAVTRGDIKAEPAIEAAAEKDPLLVQVAESRKAYALALHNRKKFFRGKDSAEQTEAARDAYEKSVKELLGKQFENLDVLTPDKQNEIAATLVTEKFKEREELMGALRELESGTFGNRFKQFWKRHAKLRLAVGIGLTAGGVLLAPSNLLIGAGLIATRAAMSGVGTTMSVEAMWDKLRSNFGESGNQALKWSDIGNERGKTLNDVAKNTDTADLEEMYAAHSLDAAYNNLAAGQRRTAIRGKIDEHVSGKIIGEELKRRYQEEYAKELQERVAKGEQTDAIIADQIASSLLDESLVASKLETRSDKNRRNAIAKWSVAAATGISVGWLIGSKGDYIRDALLGKSAKETGKAALGHPTSASGSSDANFQHSAEHPDEQSISPGSSENNFQHSAENPNEKGMSLDEFNAKQDSLRKAAGGMTQAEFDSTTKAFGAAKSASSLDELAGKDLKHAEAISGSGQHMAEAGTEAGQMGKSAAKAGKEVAKHATEDSHDAIVTAKKGDSVWKIIDRELGKRLDNYGSLSDAQKTYIIDSLKDKVVASPKTFGLENAGTITPGQKVDLTSLFETKATVAKAAKAAASLTKEQLANIDAGREAAAAAAKSTVESVGQETTAAVQEGKALFKEASLDAGDASTTAGKGIATVGNEEISYNNESALSWPKGMDTFREAASDSPAIHDKSIVIEKAGKTFERIGKLTDKLPESTVKRIADLRVGDFMKRGIVAKLEVMEGVTHNGAEKIAKAVKEIIKQADHAHGTKVGRTWTLGILSNIVKVVEKPK